MDAVPAGGDIDGNNVSAACNDSESPIRKRSEMAGQLTHRTLTQAPEFESHLSQDSRLYAKPLSFFLNLTKLFQCFHSENVTGHNMFLISKLMMG